VFIRLFQEYGLPKRRLAVRCIEVVRRFVKHGALVVDRVRNTAISLGFGAHLGRHGRVHELLMLATNLFVTFAKLLRQGGARVLTGA